MSELDSSGSFHPYWDFSDQTWTVELNNITLVKQTNWVKFVPDKTLIRLCQHESIYENSVKLDGGSELHNTN